MRPFDVSADQIKHLHVTVHVPEHAVAGLYTGRIEIESPGAGSLALPLTVRVLPFDLVACPIDYGLYYQGRLGIHGFPQSDREEPETFRRHYGVRLWQAGYDVEMTYAYQHGFGHAWNDFDYRGRTDYKGEDQGNTKKRSFARHHVAALPSELAE